MRYFWLIFVCALLSSCVRSRVPQASEDIQGLLDDQVYQYQKEDKDKFFDDVSEQYYSGYQEFKYQVEDFLYNNSNINLDFSIEKILASGRQRSVEVKWHKTYVNRQGNPVKRQGFATLFFDISGKRPVLINIKGNNPFTQ